MFYELKFIVVLLKNKGASQANQQANNLPREIEHEKAN
jgi:hypothetical protein